MTENFPQINVRHTTSQLQAAHSPKDKMQKKKKKKAKSLTLKHIIFKLQKIKDKEKKPERSQRKKKWPYL